MKNNGLNTFLVWLFATMQQIEEIQRFNQEILLTDEFCNLNG